MRRLWIRLRTTWRWLCSLRIASSDRIDPSAVFSDPVADLERVQQDVGELEGIKYSRLVRVPGRVLIAQKAREAEGTAYLDVVFIPDDGGLCTRICEDLETAVDTSSEN